MAVLQLMDHTILQGHRGQEAQDLEYVQGRSKLPWPKSNHNTLPSEAVDATPYPIDWKDISRQAYFAGLVVGVASSMGIKIRCGIDFDMDNKPAEKGTWIDAPHFELVKPKDPIT